MTSSGKTGFCTSCRSLAGKDDEKSCPDCAAPLVMFADEVLKKSEQEPAPSIEQQGQRITLSPGSDISFGTSNDCHHRVDAMSSGFQASIVYRQADKAYWIIDYGKRPRTWINGIAVKTCRLEYGNLVQVGSVAWTYLRVDKKDQLESVTCVDGARVEYYRDLPASGEQDEERLREKVLEIKPGEFVAVIGASGAGKSTLLKTLIGKDVPDDVQIIIEDGEQWIDVNSSSDALHKVLGYVSQEAIIHDEFSAREILYQAFSFADQNLRFRDAFTGGIKKHEKRISDALLQLGVPEKIELNNTNRWNLEFRQLSGGEQKRVRTAHELIRGPKLLLLDEPGSGLDVERERDLMLRLKHLSHCGITVVIVLHNLPMVQYCDHFYWFDEGDQTHQGAGEDFDPYCDYKSLPPTSRSLGVMDRSMVEAKLGKSPAIDVEQISIGVRGRLSRWWAQGGMLLRREFKLSAKPRQPLQRIQNFGFLHNLKKMVFHPLAFWLFWMPLAFALIIGVSVSAGGKNLLGFLSVLAVIWMGASLGVRRIVDKREIFEHEHLIFLRATPYVLAKVVCYSLLAIPQTIVYVALLFFIRRYFTLDFFFQASSFSGVIPDVVCALLPITLAGVAAGLLISAIANHDRNRPNQFLPILMVCQIIFSATIMIKDGARMELRTKFDEFHAHQCEVHRELKARKHDELTSLWLCRPCERELRRWREARQEPAAERLVAELKKNVKTEMLTSDEKQKNSARRWGTWASYLMISRWGDLALHSTAIQQDQGDQPGVKYLTAYGDNYDDSTEGRTNKEFVDGVRTRSRWVLFGIYFGLVLSTIWVLKLQVRRKPKPDPEKD
jgi:ABC-type multidrug transport system ATPase subunit